MHVKESVKEFVYDVKRKFSQKRRKRDTTYSIDTYDGASSSADGLSQLDDSMSSSSSDFSLPSTPERGRFSTFIRSRTVSTSSKRQHDHNVLHKARKTEGKRYRLFSAPSRPSPLADDASTLGHRQAASERQPSSVHWSPGSFRDTADECTTFGSSQGEHMDVIDIHARSVMTKTKAVSSVGEESQLSSSLCGSTLQSQPLYDRGSSGTSGTLFSSGSGPNHNKSASESDFCFDSVCLHSDRAHDIIPVVSWTPSMAQDHEIPPVPPPKHEQPDLLLTSPREEEIALAQPSSPLVAANIDNTPLAPLAPQASHATTPVRPIRSTTSSPAPVIPRLTAPSMFLPIPNTDPLNPLLTRYVPLEQRPRRDVVGEYGGRDVHEMVMSNSWRALAKMARDRIVASEPEDLGKILDLWSLRLSSLARLRLTNQASAECTNLFAVLNAVPAMSVPGSFPGLGSLARSAPLPPFPVSAATLSLSPSGLGGLAQLPGTPSQKPSSLPGLGSIPAARHHAHDLVHPFELTVFHARVHYWSGDPLGYVDALSQILMRCKERAREEGRLVVQRRSLKVVGKVEKNVDAPGQSREASEEMDDGDAEDTEEEEEDAEEKNVEDTGEGEGIKGTDVSREATEVQEEEERDDVLTAAEANLSMWLERVARICLILASQMIEMNDYQAAINLLAPLCTYRAPLTLLPAPSPALHSALARVYLLAGNLQKAEEHFSVAASAAGNDADDTDVAVNTALLAAASGDWTRAEEALTQLVAKNPGNFAAINNLAVVLLSQGRIKEGIDLLEAALKTSPSSVVIAEPFLFNLSTLYELRSTAAIDKKRELLIEVAKWSGDGLKTSCLKMPST